MIIEVTIENWLSYKKRTVFSMEATKDKKLTDNYVKCGNYNLLKTAAIYGANAAGKSNFYKIMTIFILLMRESNRITINDKLPIVPFLLDKNSQNKLSFFEMKFITNNERYTYGFKANKDNISEEYLYGYPKGKKTILFSRTNINDYIFNSDQTILNTIKKQNTNNKFFLSTATNLNYPNFKDAYNFITQKIETFQFDKSFIHNIAKEYYNDKDGDLKKFALKQFKKADIQIDDFDIKEVNILNDANITQKYYSITITHNVDGKKIFMDLSNESLGTQVLFTLLPIIKNGLDSTHILFVDELDRSLHPVLVKYIVNLFNESEINKKGSQLIFNTHDTNLLDLNDLRRDQIWFVEKNNKNGESLLYSLCEFSPRNTENIEKGYLLGKFGAVPFISNDIKVWQEE